MALQLGALRDALLAAGAPAEKADKAAEELAGYDSDMKSLNSVITSVRAELGQQISRVRAELGQEISRVRAELGQEISGVRAELRQEIASVRGDINLLRWMVGANFALTLAVFIKLFVH